MEQMSVTQLRANLYKVVDEVLATGIPQRVMRGNESILLKPEKQKTKSSSKKRWDFDSLPQRDILASNADDDNFSPWDEKAWLKKWDDRLGK